MIIYIYPNGNWLYDWEMRGFTMAHKTVVTGGRWVDLDCLHEMGPFSEPELIAISEALGEE
jgi:hypothetical protein